MLINIFGQLDLQFNLLTEIIKNVTQFNELMSLLQLSSHDMLYATKHQQMEIKGLDITVIA